MEVAKGLDISMNERLLNWVRQAALDAGSNEGRNEHLDYFGLVDAVLGDPVALRSVFRGVAREVSELGAPMKVALVCPVEKSVSAYSRPVPSLDSVWQHLRHEEPPSIYLLPFGWCLVKEEVVEARIFYSSPKPTEGVYLRTFRRCEYAEEPDSYDSALYLESFSKEPTL